MLQFELKTQPYDTSMWELSAGTDEPMAYPILALEVDFTFLSCGSDYTSSLSSVTTATHGPKMFLYLPFFQAKVVVAEQTEKDIDETRSQYIPVAVRTQILFFCTYDLVSRFWIVVLQKTFVTWPGQMKAD